MSGKVCPQCNTEYPDDQLFCPKDGSTLKSKGGTGDLVGSIVQKVYHVKKKLGEGGMGTVYLAEHVKMGRKAALKVMNPGMHNDADAISRFNREAANASKINHPNVAAVYDFGETEDGLIFLAMEFIEGPSLTKVIEENKSLSPTRAAEITRQAAEALSVAHDLGIVHRDLKPDNIMLATGREGVDIVKVVDFGIAKAGHDEGQKVTKTGMVVGTPEYMSPEQLSGDKLDGKSDTYSLALVAFNMMTGKLPFPGATSQETMIARLMEQPKSLAEMKPDTPWTAEVQAVMDRALAREAVDRYPTAAEFGRALSAAVAEMPHAHEVTHAQTAVMSPPPAAAAKTAAAPKAAPVPKTRIGSATPMANTATIPAEAPKSKMRVYAGIAVVVVGVAIGAVKFLGGGSTGAPQAPPGELKQPIANGSTPATPASQTAVIDWDTEFAKLDTATDVMTGTMTTATVALSRLDTLRLQVQSDTAKKARVALLTAKAHFVMSVNASSDADQQRELLAGCAILKSNEGLAAKGGLSKTFEFWLKDNPSAKPPTKAFCP